MRITDEGKTPQLFSLRCGECRESKFYSGKFRLIGGIGGKITDEKSAGTGGFDRSDLSSVDFKHSKTGPLQFITEECRIFGHTDNICIVHFIIYPEKVFVASQKLLSTEANNNKLLKFLPKL